MRRSVKIAVIIVAVVLLAAFVMPMAFKGKIAEIVRREANEMLCARLDFETLDISLLRHFPNASVELKGLTLVGEERFAGDTIAAARRISIVVDLLSLFGDGGFEVSKIIVAAPCVYAHKLSDGATNWDVMNSSESVPETPLPLPQTDAAPLSFRFLVRDLRITDAVVRYDDDSTHMRVQTGPATLRLKGDMSASQSDLALHLVAKNIGFISGGLPLLSGAEAELDAVISADLESKKFTFSRNNLRLNAIELSLDGWVALLDDAVSMDLVAGCDRVQFKDMLSMIPVFYTRDFRDLTASGEMSMALGARGELSSTTLPVFELKVDVLKGSFQYSSLPKAVTDINLAARISNPGGAMDQTVVDISNFAFKMGGNAFAASLRAVNPVSNPTFRAAARGRIDLGAVKEVYPLAKGEELGGVICVDVKAAGSMSDIENQRYEQMEASGTFVVEQMKARLTGLPDIHIRRAAATITPQAMTLGELSVTLGQSDLAANGQLTGYIGYLLRGGILSGRLYVKSDVLDLNEIMATAPAAVAETTGESTEEPVGAAAAIVIPHNLSLSLNAEMNKILFRKMTIANLEGEMHTSEGVLSLDGLSMGLFGGKATASGSYSSAQVQRPSLKLKLGLDGASFQTTFDEIEMVQKLVPLFSKTGGDYSLSLDMSTMLDIAMSPELKTLDATGELRSSNIKIQNISAFDVIAKTLNNDDLRNIEARDVTIGFTIREGRITTRPFDLNIGDININLSGSTGLDQSIDYAVRIALPEALGGGVLSTIHANIGGTFSSPKITLGLREAAVETVKSILGEQVEKLTGGASLGEAFEKQAARLKEEAVKAGEKLIAVAEEQSAKLIESTKDKGPLAKIATKKAGEKLVEEASKQAIRIVEQADMQIEKMRAEAQK